MVVHAVRPGSRLAGKPDEAEAALRAAMPDGLEDGLTVELLSPEGYPPDEITELADEVGAQLIVTGVARYNDIGDYFLGTAVDFIIRHAHVPVLVVKQRPHAPYARIVAGSDLSGTSAQALGYAGQLLPQAAIRLIHGWSVPFAGWQKSKHVAKEVEEGAQESLDAFIASDLIAPEVKTRITAMLVEGSPEKTIRAAIAEWPADLLVLGSQGHTAMHRAFLGSTAENLLGSAPIDTLIVPPSGE